MFFRKKTSGGRAYLQIVENRREDGAVRHQVIAPLGRLEDLRENGQLDRLLLARRLQLRTVLLSRSRGGGRGCILVTRCSLMTSGRRLTSGATVQSQRRTNQAERRQPG